MKSIDFHTAFLANQGLLNPFRQIKPKPKPDELEEILLKMGHAPMIQHLKPKDSGVHHLDKEA